VDGGSLGDRIGGLMGRARDDLSTLLAFPSVADPRQFPVTGCRQAADFVARSFAGAGLPDVRILDTPDGHQAVFGQCPGPPDSPTVLLYSHYDVQPPLDDKAWASPPWELTERGGRWYGRGAADCKGNIVAQLTALRAIQGWLRVGVKVISEGSEEQSTGGLAALIRDQPSLLRADAVLVCDAGNVRVGQPTLVSSLRGVVHATVTVRALVSPVHSGNFGGPTPDPVIALIQMLASLHDEKGNTTIAGLRAVGRWEGPQYPARQYRSDAGILPGVDLVGAGTIADMLWASPALTVTGIDIPPVVGSTPAIQAEVRAKINLRLPHGTDAAEASRALAAQLRRAAPWNVEVDVTELSRSQPFHSPAGGPGYTRLAAAMRDAFGQEPVRAGLGGSMPTCQALAETYPEAEIVLLGVEEPRCLIHAPNESVDPSEIEKTALALALFLIGD